METQRVREDFEAFEALRIEFYPKENKNNFTESIKTQLAVSTEAVKESNSYSRGVDLYTVREENKLVGVLLNKSYRWEVIKNQLFFKVFFEKNCISSLCLTKFCNFFSEQSQSEFVGELAYYWVTPSYRGKGLGSYLFKLSMSEFKRILGLHTVFFTLVMGRYVQNPIGPQLQRYLLAVENRNNGLNDEGTIKITGITTGTLEMKQNLGLNTATLLPNDKSIATLTLSEKNGLLFKGLSKNLSIVYTSR